MKLISHRGNINGRILEKQNSPYYINYALNCGYDVQVDIWYKNKNVYLGHDYPLYFIPQQFVKKNNLWCHAKNIDALKYLIDNNINCFAHNNDDYVLTSSNHIWVYPGKSLIDGCVAVKPEGLYTDQQLKVCYGICSDFVQQYKI